MRQLRACDFCGDDALGAFEVVPPELSPTEAEQRRVVLCQACRATLEELLEPLLARAGVVTVDETDEEIDDAAVETPTSSDGTQSSNTYGTPADDVPTEESSTEDSSTDANPSDEPTAEDSSTDANPSDEPTAEESSTDANPSDEPAAEGSSAGDDSSDGPAGDHSSDVADSIEEWAGETPSGDGDSAGKSANEEVDSDIVVVTHANESMDEPDTSRDESAASGGALTPEYGKLLRLLRNRDLPMNRSKVEALASGAYDLDGHEVEGLIDAAVDRGDLVDDGGRIRLP